MRDAKGPSSAGRELFRSSALLSCVVVAVFGLLFSVNFYHSQMSKAFAVNSLANKASTLFVDGYFRELTNTISFLASNVDIHDAMVLDEPARRRALAAFMAVSAANENCLYVYAGYEDGSMIIDPSAWTPPEGFDPTVRPWYREAMAARPGTAIGVPYTEAVTQVWVISTSRALRRSDGAYTGVVSIECLIDNIATLLRKYKEYESGYSFVVNRHGEIILHHNESLMGAVIPEIAEAIESEEEEVLNYRMHGVKKIAHHSVVPSTGWTVVTAVEESEIINPIVARVVVLILVTGVIALLLGLVQSVILGRRFSRPLRELNRKVRAVVNGEELGVDNGYRYPGNEIGAIAEEVGRLASNELYKRNIELRESEEQFKALFLESPVSIIIHDKNTGEIVDANKAACAAYGLSSLEELKSSKFWLDPPYSFDNALEWIHKAAIEGTQRFEWMNCKATGEVFWELVSLRCVTVKGVDRILATGIDITERKRAEEKIHQMAYHDSLTGLANRELLSDRLGIALAHARRNDSRVALAMLDLDNFKNVNDNLGHEVGDLLLKAAAERLSEALRESDTVARFGGDEFVLMLSDLKELDDVIPVARKVIEGFRSPFFIGTNELHVTTSMGVAVHPDHGADEKILLKNADIAMYQAKQKGRNRYQIYNRD